MFESLITFMKEIFTYIKDCRGKSYDNSSPMSEKYIGLQLLVLKENNLAVWVPCFGYSLILVGQSAAQCCLSAIKFFYFSEEYVFFTALTNRYHVLVISLKKNQKGQGRTRETNHSSKTDKYNTPVMPKPSNDKDDLI